MTIRRITEEERQRAAEAERDRAERECVEIAFADWVIGRSRGERPVHVPPLSEQMMTTLRALLCEEKP